MESEGLTRVELGVPGALVVVVEEEEAWVGVVLGLVVASGDLVECLV